MLGVVFVLKITVRKKFLCIMEYFSPATSKANDPVYKDSLRIE